MRSGVVVAVGAVASVASVWLACNDAVRSHVFSGRQYDPTRRCLLDLTSIDVVEGPEPETPCAPVCVVSLPDDSGAQNVYVSTMCAPYPIYPYDSDAGSNPECAAALLANQYNTSCEDDGAIYNLPPEAGPDATAEASADATADASTTPEASTDALIE